MSRYNIQFTAECDADRTARSLAHEYGTVIATNPDLCLAIVDVPDEDDANFQALMNGDDSVIEYW